MPVGEVCGHRLIFESGDDSQTVNVCHQRECRGVYGWIIRLRRNVPGRPRGRDV